MSDFEEGKYTYECLCKAVAYEVGVLYDIK